MTNSSAVIVDFTLGHLSAEPLPRRIELCRALANLVGDESHRAELLAIAFDLERIEARQRKLALDFKRRAEG